MNIMTARDFRDAGMSKLRSLNASSTPTERTITSYRTASSTRNPFLSIFPWIWTTQTIRWRAFWTTKVCMPHSLLLSHDKFMLQKLRPPRFALSCNSRKKREKKTPVKNAGYLPNRTLFTHTRILSSHERSTKGTLHYPRTRCRLPAKKPCYSEARFGPVVESFTCWNQQSRASAWDDLFAACTR